MQVLGSFLIVWIYFGSVQHAKKKDCLYDNYWVSTPANKIHIFRMFDAQWKTCKETKYTVQGIFTDYSLYKI